MSDPSSSTVGVLASSHQPVRVGGSDSWQAAVLLYNSDDNRTAAVADDITVSLRGLSRQEGEFYDAPSVSVGPPSADSRPASCAGLVYVTYYMDNNVTNPYQLWQSMGSPDYPTAQQFRALRRVQVSRRLGI